jgi:CRISPR-associated protein Cmr2
MESNPESTSLLKFQIGPVQDFIAQARSTRDLWSGSYLLSWLVAAGIKALPSLDALIFPARQRQPLLDEQLDPDAAGILTPNLPNIFIAEVASAEARQIARDVEKAVRAEWKAIAAAVWEKRSEFALNDKLEDRFDAQVDRHLSISWQVAALDTPGPVAYPEAYKRNGWHLDAVRQTRDFMAWASESGPPEKDSLSGREEALLGGVEHKQEMEKRNSEYASLFSKHADYLGAVAIIKRCWHLAYLVEKKHLAERAKQFTIRSIPAIAARTNKHDDSEDPQEKVPGDKYIAAIAFDGDSIGKWVNGDFLPDKNKLAEHHADFSATLSDFALNRVRKIVGEEVDRGDDDKAPARVPLGQLIYAGGDDVVALVPADAALQVASALRDAFRAATDSIKGTDNRESVRPDASAGIAIAHIHSPLQDLIREAQKAEKRAKIDGPKPAFSVTLMKRSGEISHWTAQWDSKAFELHEAIFKAMTEGGPDGKKLSAKFPHRLCELLAPYSNRKSGLSRQSDAPDFAARSIIEREFLFAAERQGSKAIAAALRDPLAAYLMHPPDDTQAKLDSMFGLATTLAFAIRNLP